MGGSSPGTITTKSESKSQPWSEQKPYLIKGYEEAENLYDSSTPNFFPGDTYVPFSPETEAALTGTTNRALQGSPVQNLAGQNYAGTLAGNYLHPSSNPYLGATMNAALRPLAEQYSESIMPSIKSTFAKGGRYGSPGQHFAEVNAGESFARNAGDMLSNMAMANYTGERNRQTQLIPGAPQFADAEYNDMNRLAKVGEARESMEQNRLSDLMQRYDFEQNKPYYKLGQYMGIVGDKNWGGTTTGTQQQPYFQPDPVMGAIGAGTSIAGTAGKFMKPTMICAECHAQGLMPDDLFEVDQAYARTLKQTDPELVAGYHRWAPYVVRAMKKSRTLSRLISVISRPVWREFQARLRGGRGSVVGKCMLAVAGPLCRFLGRGRKPDLSWEMV